MPPRHAYWTIIYGNQPTSFRAATQDELLPTLNQLRVKHPDAVMMWFARGRLWPSPEAALVGCWSSRCPFPIGSLEQARRSHGGPFWGIGVDGVLSSDVEAGDRARWWRERRMVGGGGQSRLLRRVEWLAVETAARARPRRRPRARRHLPLLGPPAD